MSRISDEMLMAYVDGEISGEERARVEAYLSSSPEAWSRLEVFAKTGRDLSGLFDDIFYAEVPQRLVDAARAARAAEMIDLQSKRRGGVARDRQSNRTFAYALAASLAAVAVLAGALVVGGLRDAAVDRSVKVAVKPADSKVAADDLTAALERTASGAVFQAEGRSIKPVFTFASNAGGYCRQYSVQGNAERLAGVACRDADGRWIIESQATLGGPAGKADDARAERIVPAGHEGAGEIEALVDRLISGDVLGPEAEERLIEGGWAKRGP